MSDTGQWAKDMVLNIGFKKIMEEAQYLDISIGRWYGQLSYMDMKAGH